MGFWETGLNPILSRELLEVLRTRKALALQLSLALLCAVLVLLRWPTAETADLSGARALQVLRVFGYGLLAGILLVVPAFPATTLVREKIKGTLALLLNSPLSPLSIYLGKLGGVMGFTAVLLVMTLPGAAACFALGGTGVENGVFALYGLLILAALQLSTLGLFVSSRSQSTDGALRVTYALVLVVCVLPLAPYALLQGQRGVFSMLAGVFRCISPIPAVLEVLGQGDVGSHGMSAGTSALFWYPLFALAMSVDFAIFTVLRLNHKFLDRARPAGVMTDDRDEGSQAARNVMFLFFFDPMRRAGSVPGLWFLPVMFKEFRTRRFGRLHWLVRLVAVCAILSLGVCCIAAVGALGWGLEIIGGALVLLQVALLILFTPSLASGLVSAERESGTWQLLRMTPLSWHAIVVGKLLSVAVPLVLVLFATLPGYIVIMVIQYLVPSANRAASEPWQVIVSLTLTAVFAVLLSACVSSVFRVTATATAASYLVLLAVCLGPLLVWLGRDAPFGRPTVEAALTLSPVAAALQAAAMPGLGGYELLPANWIIIGSACAVFLAFLAVRTWQLSRPE
jgi:ABC-type transport system involved in multi-copper enzyme maturation permease subunit